MAKKLTRDVVVENGSFLDRKSMKFRFCIQECLDNKYCFKKMDKGSLKELDKFIAETAGKIYQLQRSINYFCGPATEEVITKKLKLMGSKEKFIIMAKTKIHLGYLVIIMKTGI